MVIEARFAGWKPSSHNVSDQLFLRNAISTALGMPTITHILDFADAARLGRI